MQLEGSCACGAIRFSIHSTAPHPYRICYCRRCRKIAGGTGAAINILADRPSLVIEGTPRRYRHGDTGPVTAFCGQCGSALFVELDDWPQWTYPFASAIDTPLPVPPHRIHMQIRDRPEWVPTIGSPEEPAFDENTDESIVDWHERLGILSAS